ncbi:hypothetical protein ACQP2P_13060 [Dactylosporangium sp. CA-139114]|uniref:hypothetical protein n=1 Tax=Dactylosporangium sp. CA-139114 TaxID=3239931 RepID=UPI003D97350F
MADPMRPSLPTKMRASPAKERDAVVLEALRSAGKAAYDEMMQADRAREQLVADGRTQWDAPPATVTLKRWQQDRGAREAIALLWREDPDPRPPPSRSRVISGPDGTFRRGIVVGPFEATSEVEC